jgi:4-hydroxymandelate oxidase
MPGVSLRRSARLGFPSARALGGSRAGHAERAVYHRDLLRPYGLDLDEAALAHRGPTYGEMGRALLERALSPREPVDLLVLAYAIPDLEPGRATATYLSHVCPGRPTAFAVSDQGTAAAFTALQLISAHLRSGDARRAVLLVLEQETLPYDPGVPVAMPSGNSGVALVFDALPGGEPADAADRGLGVVAVSVEPGRPGTPPALPSGATTVLGAGLGAAGRAEDRPYTGVWWELAGFLHTGSPPPEHVLLADLEPVTSTRCLAEFRTLG